MAIHATARVEWAIARLTAWAKGLSLTGSPLISRADGPPRSDTAGPWVRLTFDEATRTPMGRFNATQTAVQIRLLMVADVFWPEVSSEAIGSTDLYGDLRVASELADAAQFLDLTFLDYTIPATPAAVSGALITVDRIDPIRRLTEDAGFKRRQVRCYPQWIARFDDYNA